MRRVTARFQCSRVRPHIKWADRPIFDCRQWSLALPFGVLATQSRLTPPVVTESGRWAARGARQCPILLRLSETTLAFHVQRQAL